MPEVTRRARDPFCLRVTVRHGGQNILISAVPDRLFSFLYDDGTRHNFALELNRGTMDIWSNRLVGKSSLRRKLIAYANAREQKRHTSVWGFTSFRVLVVTTSEERMHNMIEAQRRAVPECPPGFFLFPTPERVERHGALGPAWITMKCDNVSILHEKCKPKKRKATDCLRRIEFMIPRPRFAPPASSARSETQHVLELDPVGRARTSRARGGSRNMGRHGPPRNSCSANGATRHVPRQVMR